jgi:hypothetical protein
MLGIEERSALAPAFFLAKTQRPRRIQNFHSVRRFLPVGIAGRQYLPSQQPPAIQKNRYVTKTY